MRSRPAALAACLLTIGAAPAAAAAAPSIKVDRPCYADPSLREDRVKLSGTGFTPDATYQVTLDGKELPGGTGQVGKTGELNGSFAAPQLSSTLREHVYDVGVVEVPAPNPGAPADPAAPPPPAPLSAVTQFGVSRLTVGFRPATGNPRTLRVTYWLNGFSLQGRVTPTVYLHWIRPDGHLERTSRLGTALGACGSIGASARQRLFPFMPQRGRWRLQFDTSRAFRKGTKSSPFLFYAISVAVKPRA
jgi:hypothetical protein